MPNNDFQLSQWLHLEIILNQKIVVTTVLCYQIWDAPTTLIGPESYKDISTDQGTIKTYLINEHLADTFPRNVKL